MFGLFGKKEAKNPEEQISVCQGKKDWAGLARAYYALGTAAMDRGDLNHAQLWLHRADTVYSARDEVYEAVREISSRMTALSASARWRRRTACSITLFPRRLRRRRRRWETARSGCGACCP